MSARKYSEYPPLFSPALDLLAILPPYAMIYVICLQDNIISDKIHYLISKDLLFR